MPDEFDEFKATTHFGYTQVPLSDKARRVAAVFDSVADRYDLMNDLMSLGIHRLWRRFTVELSGVRNGDWVLDLAGGTGDLSARFAGKVGPTGCVVLADVSPAMVFKGRARLADQGVVGNVEYVLADGESLPFRDDLFHCVSIAFGLRNFTDKSKALASIHRVLRPGGRLLVLEFSRPTVPLLAPLYDAYSFRILPVLGKLVVGDAQSYRYLAESIRVHPDQETLRAMMQEAGLERCEYFNLSGGIVAVHRGYKL